MNALQKCFLKYKFFGWQTEFAVNDGQIRLNPHFNWPSEMHYDDLGLARCALGVKKVFSSGAFGQSIAVIGEFLRIGLGLVCVHIPTVKIPQHGTR